MTQGGLLHGNPPLNEARYPKVKSDEGHEAATVATETNNERKANMKHKGKGEARVNGAHEWPKANKQTNPDR